jgi:Prokaryotic dksA/traR C4-type zinc finger.
MPEPNLHQCANCGLLYCRPEPPADCACGATTFDRVDYTALVDAALTDDEMDMGDSFETASDLSECPSCGESYPEDDIQHELGGAHCPSCR